MHVTVAVCTYNRASLLSRTLERLTGMRQPPSRWTWDLVVIDNASTDGTADVLAAFRGRLPLRALYEPKQGIAHARNAAVAAARGDYLLWTDDDVLVSEQWMVEYIAAFERHPEAAFFGGPIEVMLEPPAPTWLVELLPEVGRFYGLRELGDTSFRLSPDAMPFGANLAVRLDVQRSHGFDTRLGHHGRHVMVGEETDMLLSLMAQGETGWWVPSARVQHVIPPRRQTWDQLASFWYAQGVYGGMHVPRESVPMLLGRPVWLWRQAIQFQWRYGLRRLRRSRLQLARDYANARIAWGAVHGASLVVQGEQPKGRLKPRATPRAAAAPARAAAPHE